MPGRLSKVSGALLLVVFAFFFASTNLCVHSHEGPRKRHGFLSPDDVFSRMTGLDAGKFVQLIKFV